MIYLNHESKTSLYMQIYNQLKEEILNGSLEEGHVLPGSRGLANTMKISRNTVNNAYAQLEAEGYIYSKKGIGSIVVQVPKLKGNDEDTVKNPDTKITLGDTRTHKPDVKYDLTNSSHTSDLFPQNLWKKYTLECMEQLHRESKISEFQEKQGELYLRQNLLTYLKRIRGVTCETGQVIITCGLQQSLEYLCNLLSDEDKKIIVEEPGYNKALHIFQNNGFEISTVPVDQNGLLVSELPEDNSICALYTTPSHQFPTGVTLPINRRYELLEWADRNEVYLLEDDFDSEQRYYARPIPSLQSIDRHDRVIYLGTFSKALSPSIRMGYMILPPRLIDLYLKKYEDYNANVPVLNQYVIGKMMETGQYDRHIRRLNQIFKKRLEAFQQSFMEISDQIKLISNGTGQYFLLEFKEGCNQKALIRRALDQGVRVYSTMQFWQDKAECPPNTLFLGLSRIRIEEIPDCVGRLKTAWREWL